MAKLSDQDKKYLLTLKPEDISFDFLVSLVGDTVLSENSKVTKKNKSKMSTHDTFTLSASEYFNKTKVDTNVGLFIYNKFIIEPRLSTIVPYVNEPINSGQLKKIETYLSKALLNDKIKQEDYVDYLDRTQWISMRMHAVLSGSFTMNTFKPNPTVIARRDKLFKDNKEAIDKNDVNVAVKIEKELTTLAKDTLKNDPGLDLYKSGARGSFDNNFKNISVMRGPIFDPTNNRFDIVKSNFVEGMRKEEIATYGTTVITGSYPRVWGLT